MIDSFFTPRSPVLPTHDSLAQLVDNFNDFFIERIHGLRRELVRVSKATTSSSITDREAPQVTLSEFSQVTSTMIHHVIKALSTKSCPLDPMPTRLLKDHLDLIVPVVTDIVNESLSTGVFPTCLKRSLIRPLLKKQDLDRENLKNYRPIANIPFLSKVIEKAVVSQINLYLETNKLNPPLQSAYRKHHSTETALLRVLDGILTSLDHRQDVVLVMLDLSAAFDTLDHEILISRLGSYFGLSDTVLHWFSSYLSGRTQSVIIGKTTSDPRPVDFGVPQGSILGPLLFNLYVAPLQDIVAANNVDSMFYADDSQIYIAIKPNDQSLALATLRNCVNAIINWNTQNMLLCNPGKTEVIQFTSRFVRNPVLSQFSFGNTIIELSDKVRDLGVILDKELNLRQHVNDTCKKAISAIRSISRIRKYMSQSNLKRIVNAFVISRIDYCNSILYGLPTVEHEKLQRVQNIAARLITGSSRRDHITPVLKNLHWLPVKLRITFKILLLTYKILNGQSPSYLTSLISSYKPVRSLRSSDLLLLQVPNVMTATYGQRTFSYCAPKLWNSLPKFLKESETVTIFKKKLKTFLFCDYFNF